jgi:hypothetical protein
VQHENGSQQVQSIASDCLALSAHLDVIAANQSYNAKTLLGSIEATTPCRYRGKDFIKARILLGISDR